jgi:hypothetical protein
VLPGVRPTSKVVVPGAELVALNWRADGAVPSTIRKSEGAFKEIGDSIGSALATGDRRPANANGKREKAGGFMEKKDVVKIED